MLRKLCSLIAVGVLTCGFAPSRAQAQTAYPVQTGLIQSAGQCCQPAPTCGAQLGCASSWGGSAGCRTPLVIGTYSGCSTISNCGYSGYSGYGSGYSGTYGTSRHRIWNFSGGVSSCDPCTYNSSYYTGYSGLGCGLLGYRRPCLPSYATNYDSCGYGSRYLNGYYGGSGWGSYGSCAPRISGCYSRRPACGAYATTQCCAPTLSYGCAPSCCAPSANCCGATSNVMTSDGITPIPQATPQAPPNETTSPPAVSPTPVAPQAPTAPTPAAPPTPGT
ncbi:hypothetical protein [Schlesneria paludicola]|uniref:hypothetical protein n=1 Tax=Schlesneria paludicola TaxID=360056 RepID=UPI0012FC1DF5|nr:hypothetical protein [Schlesneria paludicola]